MNRLMLTLRITIEDLFYPVLPPWTRPGEVVPLVRNATAALVEVITPDLVLQNSTRVSLALPSAKSMAAGSRLRWTRYVATRVTRAHVRRMYPVLQDDYIVAIDRHFIHTDPPHRTTKTIYAISKGPSLRMGYLRVVNGSLVLYPANPENIPETIKLGKEHVLIGRVCAVGSMK